ncbi:MAG: hypothetical protein HY466_03645, partial [Deltaproteobacteria bacterium]|nr:hypothetical protein [Deltaproteobacteria bacterium]
FWLFLVFALLLVHGPWSTVHSPAHACGHEGTYAGLGYTQLIQFSPDHQLVAAGGTSPRINWSTRWGTHLRVGHDFCQSRWGFEVPFSLDRQRLNRNEFIHQIGIDANAIYHILETEGGIDFYWIGGTGLNFTTEGAVSNNTGATGINLNFGPGFQYFVKQAKPNVAIGLAVPVKYTLYFGNNLSGNKRTSVIGLPIRVGFSVGF